MERSGVRLSRLAYQGAGLLLFDLLNKMKMTLCATSFSVFKFLPLFKANCREVILNKTLQSCSAMKLDMLLQ